MRKLSDLQERFCQEFIIDGKPYPAAERAGYEKKALSSVVPLLLENELVKQRIKEIGDEIIKRMRHENHLARIKLDQEDIMKEIENIVSFRVTDVVDITPVEANGQVIDNRLVIKSMDDLSDAALSNIAGIRQTKYGIEVKFHDKMKALEQIGRIHGMFVDRVKVENDLEVEVRDFTDANYVEMVEESSGLKAKNDDNKALT